MDKHCKGAGILLGIVKDQYPRLDYHNMHKITNLSQILLNWSSKKIMQERKNTLVAQVCVCLLPDA